MPSTSDPDTEIEHSQPSSPVETTPEPSFKHLPPQNRTDVIREAEALFSRILDDSAPLHNPELSPSYPSSPPDATFNKVRLTPRLLNAYLSVHYSHSSLEVIRKLFGSVFSDHGVERNARSYVEALERCAVSPRRDRDIALSFAEDVWRGWCDIENAHRLPNGRQLSARLIERANVAMIRMLTLTNNLDRALTHLRAFVSHYPPSAVRQPSALPAMRSTRTALNGARPLVRFTTATEVPDDTIPPLIGFSELEILHQRLVAAGKTEALGYVKYVCKTYEGALRSRRDATMRATATADDR